MMRDLAGQNLASPRPTYAKRMLRLIVLLVIIGGVVFLLKNRINIGGIGSGASVVLREAPRGLTPVKAENAPSATEGGVDLATQSATFTDVKFGGEAVASATRSFGGGTYVLSVDATLPDPKNTYYEVWLVGDDEVIPVDFMTGSKTKWSLRLRSGDKYSSYSGIWITLERTKDELPEERVLEGSF